MNMIYNWKETSLKIRIFTQDFFKLLFYLYKLTSFTDGRQIGVCGYKNRK